MLNVKRLGGTEQNPFAFEIEGYHIGCSGLLFHLEKKLGVKVIAKFSYPMTDDCWADFEYKGYRFSIESPMAYLWVQAESSDMPEPVFKEIEDCVRRINPFNILEIPARILARMRYALLPFPSNRPPASGPKHST